jgi:predicted nucleic acid-binding protein
LDTTFLISLADGNRSTHAAACDYYRHFLEHGIDMLLPTVVIAEFAQKQSISDLPMRNFRVLPFNLSDALQCAALNVAHHRVAAGQMGQRDAVKDDFKIIAHAKVEEAGLLLTDDGETLAVYCDRLRTAGKIGFRTVLLRNGFDAAFLNPAGQSELPLQSTP